MLACILLKMNNKNPTCNLCLSEVRLIFKSKILNKYDVSYFQCKKCKHIQTEHPYWLKEAYSSAIADADTGLLSRNLTLSKITAGIIYFLFNKNGKHLDYAGGYGVFTRLMRDIGFDYYWEDLKSENVFAKNFEADKRTKFQVVTSFEFLEHVEDPLKEIKNIFNKYNNEALLFSTMLYKEPLDKDWWYFTFATGQHISFYKKETLSYIAEKLGLNFYTNGVNMHLMTKKPVSDIKFSLISKFWFIFYFWVYLRMKSKTFADHLMMINRK